MGAGYAAVFVAVLVLWPVAAWPRADPAGMALALAANAAGVALIWYRSAAPDLGFFAGLAAIGERMRVGFLPASVVILAVVFPAVTALAAVHTLIGLAAGRGYTRRRWAGVVQFFLNLM